MKKFLGLLYCILALTVLDFPIAGILKYSFHGETDFDFFQEHPFIRLMQKIATIAVLIIIILLISSLLKNIIRVRLLFVNGLFAGLISSSIVLTFVLLVYLLSSFEWKTNTANCISMGMHAFLTGFLFPVLYRWFNKKPLFNGHFY